MICINLSGIAILHIKISDYCCIFTLISKNEALKLMQDADSTEKWVKKFQSLTY